MSSAPVRPRRVELAEALQRRRSLARCLIIACGCRGRSLARQLHARGHAVRGTTRHRARFAEIEAAGAEPWLGDPDRIGTIAPAFEHVSVVCVLLGSAIGRPAHVADLHRGRLEMMLARMLDTTVRGVVYEARGRIDQHVLRGGSEIVRSACLGSRIPFALLGEDPVDDLRWLGAALEAVKGVLGGG